MQKKNVFQYLPRYVSKYKGVFDIIVIRITYNNTLSCSTPCSICSNKLKYNSKIRKVYWINSNGLLECCLAKDLHNTQISDTTKRRIHGKLM